LRFGDNIPAGTYVTNTFVELLTTTCPTPAKVYQNKSEETGEDYIVSRITILAPNPS